MKLQNISYKILFSILFFALAGIVFLLKINGKVTKVSAAWWDSTWIYRKSITITNTSGSDKTNVLVKVLDNYDLSSLVSASKLQSDLDDLRFTDNNDQLISHWTQDNTSTSADVWVVIPSVPSSGTTIWIYYGNSSASSVSTPFYSYSGTSQFIDDTSGNFRIKFLDSGTLTPSASISIDAFLVGGGGGGAGHSSTNGAGGGGGGGYTGTWESIPITVSTQYSIGIGGGGAGGAGKGVAGTGGTTTAFGYSKTGGLGGSNTGDYTWSQNPGGAGGCGGGRSGYYDSLQYYGGTGGSDGSNGVPGATGQGTTTKEFSEVSGTLYAGGGGGAAERGDSTRGPGGSGGGGAGGGSLTAATSGTANTGGGGGGNHDGANGASGGSGIVVIRLNPITTISINGTEEVYANVYIPSNCRISESTNDSQLTVLWNDTNTDEDNYLVQKSTNGGTWTDLNYAAQNSTSYADTSISSNNTYQYRISPYVSGSTDYLWCYTSTLNLGQGNFNFEGVDFEGINID